MIPSGSCAMIAEKEKRVDMVQNQNWYLSTVAEEAEALAARYGLGLEIAEYCTASNMDDGFAQADAAVRRELARTDRAAFHLPFNELCPAAIDPRARRLAWERYRQGIALAGAYGINRLVVHSGYIPLVYDKTWFAERSVEFWTEFLREVPADALLCMENVMENEPGLLLEIIRRVDDPRLRLCLDVGHANSSASNVPVSEWIDCCAPYLSHVHLHNNEGDRDLHAPLGTGTIDMEKCLTELVCKAPGSTLTIESVEAGPSVNWLLQRGFLRR